MDLPFHQSPNQRLLLLALAILVVSPDVDASAAVALYFHLSISKQKYLSKKKILHPSLRFQVFPIPFQPLKTSAMAGKEKQMDGELSFETIAS